MMPTSSATRARRESVRDELVSDFDGLMTAIEADLRTRMLTPDPLGRQHTLLGVQLVEWLVLRWLDLWVDAASTSETDVEKVRQEGIRSAEAGIALELILQAWRLTPRSVIETLQQAAGTRLDPLDILDLTHLILDASDRLAEVFEISYAAAAARRVIDPPGARAQLMQDILAGNQASVITIEERSAAAGLALPTSPVVFALVVDQESMEAPSSDDLDQLIAELLSSPTGSAKPDAAPSAPWSTVYQAAQHSTGREGSDTGVGALLASEAVARRLCAPIEQRGWYAAAARVPSWAECAIAFKRTRLALAAVPHWALVDRHILREGDVRVLTMLRESGQDRSAKTAVAGAVLGPLLEPEHTPVLAAVEAFLAEGSAALAARRLRLHPQTLRKRLTQASELTGRSLQSSWDRFVLDLATTVTSAAL